MNIMKSIAGVAIFFFGVIFTVVTYYTVPVLIEAIPSDTIKAFFWVGLISLWILLIIIAPFTLIIQGQEPEDI